MVLGIARDEGVRLAVKSKSMATEEIHLNAALEAEGVEVVETDLGEYIIQLAHEMPSHIIAPAVHKTVAQVARLFSRGGRGAAARRPHRPVRLRPGAAAEQVPGRRHGHHRRQLRRRRHRHDRARHQRGQRPDVHVAAAGPRGGDAGGEGPAPLRRPRRAPAAADPQRHRPAAVDLRVDDHRPPPARARSTGPSGSTSIFLDHNRRSLLGTPYQEMLCCIRCGACLNVCPVYRRIGGHAYDAVYSGPMGAVLTPLLSGGTEGRDLPDASSLCGACSEACPVGIPLADMLVRLRADLRRPRPRRSSRRPLARPRRPTARRAGRHRRRRPGPPGRHPARRPGRPPSGLPGLGSPLGLPDRLPPERRRRPPPRPPRARPLDPPRPACLGVGRGPRHPPPRRPLLPPAPRRPGGGRDGERRTRALLAFVYRDTAEKERRFKLR